MANAPILTPNSYIIADLSIEMMVGLVVIYSSKAFLDTRL